MRVLLINPGMNLEKLGRFSSLLEPMPCTGLAYIAAALLSRGVHVTALDMFAEGLGVNEVLDRIAGVGPDIVGLSVMTPSAPVCRELATRIRATWPELRLIWGGIHADVFADEIVRAGYADAVVHGEGEEAICEIIQCWETGDSDLGQVRGVTWAPEPSKSMSNEPRPLNTNLDGLATPAWHLFPVHRYGLLPFADMARPVLTMSASRGCPHHCDYCSLIHSSGKSYRKRDPISVVDEYQFLVERYGVRQIGFVDPIFPLEKADLERFCVEMTRRGLEKRCVWLSETRADRLDRESCRLMYASGCRRVLLGIESGSERLLSGVGKSLSRERVIQGVANAHRAGLQTVGLFMIGLPGETPRQTRETVEFASSLGLDFAKFAITVPFPGSKLFQRSWQRTLFRDDWENYTTFNPDPDGLVYHPHGYDPALLVKLQSWALRRFYIRIHQIHKQLLELRTLRVGVLARGLYGALVP